MLIHAYRRVVPVEVDLTPRGALTPRLIQFYLNDAKAVVAEVDGEREQEMLLAVPEAYKEYEAAPIAAAAPAPMSAAQRQAAAEQDARIQQQANAVATQAGIDAANRIAERDDANVALKGSAVHAAVISLTGSTTLQLGDLIAQAFSDSGMTKDEWNNLDGDEREAIISRKLEVLEDDAEKKEEADAQAIRDKIAADAKAAKEAEESAAAAAAALKYTLKHGDITIDLKAMDDKELRAFAKSYNVTLPTGVKGDQIRQVIVDALAPVKD